MTHYYHKLHYTNKEWEEFIDTVLATRSLGVDEKEHSKTFTFYNNKTVRVDNKTVILKEGGRPIAVMPKNRIKIVAVATIPISRITFVENDYSELSVFWRGI